MDLESAVLAPFVLIQASIVVCLWLRGRKEKTFRQAFYIFFMTGTIADCLLLVLEKIQIFITVGVVTFDGANGWIRSGSFWTFVVKIVLQLLLQVYTVVLMCQPLVHTIIAINRLTAFAFPTRHSTIWNRRVVTASIFGMATLAILLSGVPYLYFGILAATEPPAAHGGPSSGQLMPWNILGTLLATLCRTMLLLACSVVAFALNVMTVAMFVLRRTSKTMSRSQRGQDVRLFVHSLFMLMVQASVSFQAFIPITDLFYEIGDAFPWVPQWAKLSSREWLAGDPNCTATSAQEAALGFSKPCGTLYMILSGKQTLIAPQNFYDDISLGEVIEDLYAISSGPFLLMVSGTARSAYSQFYFKRCRRKNNKVSLIQVTPSSSTLTNHRPSIGRR